jgi:hypothetical protein
VVEAMTRLSSTTRTSLETAWPVSDGGVPGQMMLTEWMPRLQKQKLPGNEAVNAHFDYVLKGLYTVDGA